jgi:hypothetical protein
VTIGSYAFAAYQQAYASRYPGLELTNILTDAGANVTPTMANVCLFGDNLKLHPLARPLLGRYLRSDPEEHSPVVHVARREHARPPPSGLPVFVAQGGGDTLVVPAATQAYVAGRMPLRRPNHLPPVLN